MKYRLYCGMCQAHAFDYDGVIDGVMESAKATFPDGSKPVEGSAVAIPCGHRVFGIRSFRIETLSD